VVTARIALERRDWARAETEARAARDGLGGLPAFRLMAATHLLSSLRRQGRGAEAATLARDEMARLARLGGPVCSEVMLRVAVAESLLEAGDREAGAGALREALRHIQLRADTLLAAGMKNGYLTGREENRRASELARAWLGAA